MKTLGCRCETVFLDGAVGLLSSVTGATAPVTLPHSWVVLTSKNHEVAATVLQYQSLLHLSVSDFLTKPTCHAKRQRAATSAERRVHLLPSPSISYFPS